MFLEALGHDLALDELWVRRYQEKGLYLLVHDLLKHLAKLQFASKQTLGGTAVAKQPGSGGGTSLVLAATATVGDAVSDDDEDDEESGSNAIERQAPKLLAYEENINNGMNSRGAVEFIIFGGEGDCQDPCTAVIAKTFWSLMKMRYFARLLVEVKRSITNDHIFQPLASAVELVRLNKKAEKPPTENVVWAVLTDLKLWQFIRVELQDEKYYISRGPNLAAPLLSTMDQTMTNGGGLVRVVAALYEIMYSAPSDTMGDRMQDSSSALSSMKDTWVKRLVVPLEQEWLNRQKDKKLKQLEQTNKQLEQTNKQLEQTVEQKDKQLEQKDKQLEQKVKQLEQKDKELELLKKQLEQKNKVSE
ncbi:hypothetical protein GPECTOR_7g1091 [Gonium pectorale]|uniref:Uncharacterized protein n=1 Tax=Gonium pectorale TaxID=33097 RepID=A0A150GU31_GONPE|nr:hypothetical protein GPECTOR_7g1091 [Gonium pectorale]|eukprot:KXZ53198.1 hypothetical protein GPECTOR_7g1091 [Gonium pectorale]